MGLLTSAGALFETWRQRTNAVRPVIVMLEKLTDNEKSKEGYSLYLVNMGQAVALNIEITEGMKEFRSVLPDAKFADQVRTEIAVGRRALIAKGYDAPVLSDVRLVVQYTDVNDNRYVSRCAGGRHSFR